MSQPTNDPGDANPTTRTPTPSGEAVAEPLPASVPLTTPTPPVPPDSTSWSVPPPPSPAWQPPAPDHGRTASVLFGLVMLAVGLWFFAETTLGLDLPRIRWSQLWPVALILVGLWIALGSLRRRSR